MGKIKKFVKSKYFEKVVICAFVFFLSVCSVSAFFLDSGNALNVAYAYTPQDEFVSVYDTYNVAGAAGGIFTPLFVFDGFDTQPLGEYADEDVPANRDKITEFKLNQDGFNLKQGLLKDRLKVQQISSTKHCYAGTLTFELKNLNYEPVVYAVGVFPESGETGVKPQIFFTKIDIFDDTVQQSFIFPEYQIALENAYGSIVVYKKTGTNKYGNPYPVFENTPGYNLTDLTSQQYDFIFFPEQVNRTSTGVLSQESRPHYIEHNETSAKKIEMTVPALGFWTWKSEPINFDNELDGETLFERPLNYTLNKSFSSGEEPFTSFTVNETAGTVNYDTYTVYSGTPGEFVNPVATQLYFPDSTGDKFFYDENAAYFLINNFNFYIKKGEDHILPEPGTPWFKASILTTILGGALTVAGLGTGQIWLGVIGAGIALAGGVGDVVSIVTNPSWQDALVLLPGRLWESLQEGIDIVLTPIKPILPTPEKTPFWNIVITVTWILFIIAVFMVVIHKKNKE